MEFNLVVLEPSYCNNTIYEFYVYNIQFRNCDIDILFENTTKYQNETTRPQIYIGYVCKENMHLYLKNQSKQIVYENGDNKKQIEQNCKC